MESNSSPITSLEHRLHFALHPLKSLGNKLDSLFNPLETNSRLYEILRKFFNKYFKQFVKLGGLVGTQWCHKSLSGISLLSVFVVDEPVRAPANSEINVF